MRLADGQLLRHLRHALTVRLNVCVFARLGRWTSTTAPPRRTPSGTPRYSSRRVYVCFLGGGCGRRGRARTYVCARTRTRVCVMRIASGRPARTSKLPASTQNLRVPTPWGRGPGLQRQRQPREEAGRGNAGARARTHTLAREPSAHARTHTRPRPRAHTRGPGKPLRGSGSVRDT